MKNQVQMFFQNVTHSSFVEYRMTYIVMRGLYSFTFFNTDVLNNYALMMSRCVTAAACSMSSSSLEKDFQLTNDTFYFSPEQMATVFYLTAIGNSGPQ